MITFKTSGWLARSAASCMAFFFGTVFLPASANACYAGVPYQFYVVDSRPTILPTDVTMFRVLPVKNGWPENDLKAQPVEVRVIEDVRGVPLKDSAYLRLPKLRSNCEEFAQSRRSSYVVGKLRTENGKNFIDLVTLIDSDDIRFTGELIFVEEAEGQPSQK